jgi:hypothetical protein
MMHDMVPGQRKANPVVLVFLSLKTRGLKTGRVFPTRLAPARRRRRRRQYVAIHATH